MAVKGMLTSLDPHSAYLTDDDYENLQESTEGQFTGLGIEIGYRVASLPSLHRLMAHPRSTLD